MASTIGLDNEADVSHRAEQREADRFRDTVHRLTSEVGSEWRLSLGQYRDSAIVVEAAGMTAIYTANHVRDLTAALAEAEG